MQELTVLYINAIIWLITLIYWWRRKKNNVGVVILALYAAIACVSCHLFQNPESTDEFGTISIFPFIYLYVTITMLIYPLFRMDYNNISVFRLPSQGVMNGICIYIIVCAIYQLIVALPEIQTGLSLMLVDNSNAVEAYIDTTDANLSKQSLSGVFNFLGFFVTTGVNFSILFFFMYLLYPKKNKWILYGMIIAVLSNPIISLAGGSREKVVTTILIFLLMYFFLRPLLPYKTKRIINVGAVFITSLLLLFFFIISMGRARGNTDNLLLGFESYFGQSFLVFDNDCLYAKGTREGNVVSPLINVLLGGQTYSQMELRNKYAFLGIDNGRFYTFVGDFVLDYGPIIAFVILFVLAIFFYKKLNIKMVLTCRHVILVYALLKLLSGFYLHQYTGIGGNLLIIELALLYLLFSDKNLLMTINKDTGI